MGRTKKHGLLLNLLLNTSLNKVYDSTKEYKLAIVCSSSKEGDKFKGAANSTLIVDELEVVGE